MHQRIATLSAAIACAALASLPALAQDATGNDQNDNKQPSTLQTIIVTGTRAFDRTAANSLAPIDVLTPKELVSTGAPDLTTALRALLPSFNFPQPSLTDATDATQPAQLRGLSPNETLVLVNGKRQHTTAILNINGSIGRGSSPVDLSAIPMNAIARIEVLRDGAAAQYGSDAIAGVINIILKGGADHGSANVSYGQYDGGQGDTWRGGADGGFSLGQNGWVHLSANYLNQDPTNHAGPDFRIYNGVTAPTDGQVTFHFGLPKLITKQAALNAQYNLGENATLYAFSIFNKRNVSAGGFFRSFNQYGVPGTSGYNAGAVAAYPNGFLPIEHSAILDNNTVLGIKGDLGGWHYDISGDTGGSHWKLHTTDTFNYSLDTASPTAFYIGTMTIRQNVFNADFSRDFDVGWYSPLSVAWGLAYRHEKFVIKEGDPPSYFGAGAQVYPGYRPGDAGSHSRTNVAEYVDLETDFSDKFSAGLAARHEHYSDFGNTTSWKLSGRYAFTPVVALRGTISTGFRAPSLQQEFYSSTAINFVNVGGGNLVPYTIRTFPVTDPAAIALGAQSLQPEKSRNFGFGLVFTPTVGPYVTLDFYQVDIDDRIVLSGNLVGDAVQNYLTSVGIPFVSGGRFFTNAVDTRTRGVDLVGTWPVQLQGSQLKFTGGVNYNKTDIRSVKPNPPQLGLAGLELPVFDREARNLMVYGTPRSKTFLAADWELGHWTVRGRLTRYGEWKTKGSTPAGDQTFGSATLLDASVSYTLDHWDFTLGGNNVTNEYPDKNNASNNYHGIITYPLTSPFGFNGSYWYASAAYRW
ncbi:MAG TPA: TonB-dependent receptor [Rhodanobacteraceae bacterium]|nr:TonB-dependent receptor [Rhodanobacteraceae bacterium]